MYSRNKLASNAPSLCMQMPISAAKFLFMQCLYTLTATHDGLGV